jgi:hypothetical protein
MNTHESIMLCFGLLVTWSGFGIFLCSVLELNIPDKLNLKQFIVFSIINGPILFILVIGFKLCEFIIATWQKSQPALDSFRIWLYK